MATQTSRKRPFPGARMKSVPHEKLNDEQGLKPLPVNNSRDGAESGNASQPGKGQLLYSGPRNQRTKGAGNCDEAGASNMFVKLGRKRPTNVTAVVKNMTNRATSAAAGVVFGAELVNRWLKRRTRMRVPQVGVGGRKPFHPHASCKAVRNVSVRQRVVPGHAQTERGDGNNLSQ